MEGTRITTELRAAERVTSKEKKRKWKVVAK